MIDFVNQKRKLVYFGSNFTFYDGLEKIENQINNLDLSYYFKINEFLIRKEAISFYFPTTYVIKNEEGEYENSFKNYKMMLVFYSQEMTSHPFIVVEDRINLQDFIDEIRAESNIEGGNKYFITKTGIMMRYRDIVYMKKDEGRVIVRTTSPKFNDMMTLILEGEIGNKDCLKEEEFEEFKHDDFVVFGNNLVNKNFIRYLEGNVLVMGDGSYDFREEVGEVDLSEYGTLVKMDFGQFILERANLVLEENLYIFGDLRVRVEDVKPNNYEELLEREEVDVIIKRGDINLVVGRNFKTLLENVEGYLRDNFVVINEEISYDQDKLEEVVGTYWIKNDESRLDKLELRLNNGVRFEVKPEFLGELDLGNFEGDLIGLGNVFEKIDDALEKDKEYQVQFSAVNKERLVKTLSFPKYLAEYEIFISNLLNINDVSLYEYQM